MSELDEAASLAFWIAEDARLLLRGYGKDNGHHCDFRAKLQAAHDRALEIRKLLNQVRAAREGNAHQETDDI